MAKRIKDNGDDVTRDAVADEVAESDEEPEEFTMNEGKESAESRQKEEAASRKRTLTEEKLRRKTKAKLIEERNRSEKATTENEPPSTKDKIGKKTRLRRSATSSTADVATQQTKEVIAGLPSANESGENLGGRMGGEQHSDIPLLSPEVIQAVLEQQRVRNRMASMQQKLELERNLKRKRKEKKKRGLVQGRNGAKVISLKECARAHPPPSQAALDFRQSLIFGSRIKRSFRMLPHAANTSARLTFVGEAKVEG